MAATEVDPWDFVTHILKSPDALDAEKSGRAFGASGARLTATERAEAADRQAILDRKPKQETPAAKKTTKAEYAAQLEAKLRANPEWATLVSDVSTKVALDLDSRKTIAYDVDSDAGLSYDELVAAVGNDDE